MKIQRLIHLAALTIIACLSLFFVFNSASAKVSGSCANCHTMHNSQGGSALNSDAIETLLANDCVGCHSATSGSTWKDATTGAPIVYNIAEPSFNDAKGLAGGNFYWVVNKGDEYGHNVLSIPGMPSDELTEAPGIPTEADVAPDPVDPTCGNCHVQIDDCTSCHKPAHHADDSATVVGETGGWYRFLKSGSHEHDGGGGVEGIEDPDWEQTKDELKHNEYKGGVLGVHGVDKSMSDYCAGCHRDFHDTEFVGTSSPWLRHPNNYALPEDTDKEYYLYNTPDGTNIGYYNPQAPVARPDLSSYSTSSRTVTPGTDQVFCLSCHRPHGTEYKDILRWNYDGMIAGGGGDDGTGCFICHTTKDG